MLEHLKELRLVHLSQQLSSVETNWMFDIGYRLVFWHTHAWLLLFEAVKGWLGHPWWVTSSLTHASFTLTHGQALMQRMDNRFLTRFNNACCPSPHQFCHVPSQVLRSSWQIGKKWVKHFLSSGPGWISACDGPRNITSKWMIQTLMSSQCVSFWIHICAPTSESVEQSSILPCASCGSMRNETRSILSLREKPF